MQKVKRDIYQEVTDQMIEGIEAGAPIWLKPWTSNQKGSSAMPHNADTGRAYSGINVLLLWGAGMTYGNNGWLTYKQAAGRGANVRKGEKGSRITFFKPLKGKDKATGKDKMIPLLRGYTVFNVEQCEWPEGSRPPVPLEPLTTPVSNMTELAAVCGIDLRIQGNTACFIPSVDQVHMPHPDSFKSLDQWESTASHEYGHWTGHKSRLDRQFGKRFGDEAYAFEELIAELTSAFICAMYGILHPDLQHDSYLDNWLKVLKSDKRAIFTAASQARQAVEYITELASIEQAA